MAKRDDSAKLVRDTLLSREDPWISSGEIEELCERHASAGVPDQRTSDVVRKPETTTYPPGALEAAAESEARSRTISGRDLDRMLRRVEDARTWASLDNKDVDPRLKELKNLLDAQGVDDPTVKLELLQVMI